ncbi:hypothetical protein BC941DRAFT_473244 [Chlamydoabsidia padenii]|nr:hypothetical protein BC941DRAFT_473244 [Chlamydoabsidia padenii]
MPPSPPSPSEPTSKHQTITNPTTPPSRSSSFTEKPETTGNNTTIRHSIVSHYSSTTASGSSRRNSFGSSDGADLDDDDDDDEQEQQEDNSDINNITEEIGPLDNAEDTGHGVPAHSYRRRRRRRPWSGGSSEHVPSASFSTSAGCSYSSLQPSSRFLLSGATSAETFRQQELLRFYPTSSSSTTTTAATTRAIAPAKVPVPPTSTTPRRIKALSDSFVTMPSLAYSIQPMYPQPMIYDGALSSASTSTTTTSTSSNSTQRQKSLDPWCMSVKMAQDSAVCSSWLHKYESPTFAFTRSWKRRFIVLTDQNVYVFKTDTKSTAPARAHFLLTDDTLIFVNEDFNKQQQGCVIEIRKPLCKWYLRCESIAQMKTWLEAMKKVVACLKLGYRGTLTASLLDTLILTDDSRLLKTKKTDELYHQQRSRLSQQFSEAQPSQYRTKRSSTPVIPSSTLPTPTTKRQSLAQIPHWEKMLPPLMPPPTSLPPPPPHRLYPSLSSSLPTSIPSHRPQGSMHRPSSAIYPSHGGGGLPSFNLPTVSETRMDPIDPIMIPSHSSS